MTNLRLRAILASLLLVANAVLATDKPFPGEKVVFYSWSEYMPEGVLEAFTEETGIQVDYVEFDTDDAMFSYIKVLDARACDVAMPSTSMVEKMWAQGLLLALDHTKIEHFDQLNQQLLDKTYDPGNKYSIPFLWGTTAIVIDPDGASPDIRSWKDLWNPQWRIPMIWQNEKEEIFYAGLRSLGFPGNSQNPDEIKQAYQKLLQLMPQVERVSSLPGEEMVKHQISLGVMWNGEAKEAQRLKPNLQYIYPEEGAYFWIDSLVVPVNAPHLENAYTLINYLLRPEVAVKWMTELGYASANIMTKPLLDEATRTDPIIFPPGTEFDKIQFSGNAPANIERLYNLYWAKLLQAVSKK